MPPDTRAVGTGNPPVDVNGLTDAVTAQGISLNILSTALAGGADPTGVADSTAAIQAALNAAAGGIVTFPPGKYLITAPLTVPSWTSVIGSGAAINNSFVADTVSTIVVGAGFTSGLAHGLSAAIALVGPGSSANTFGGQLFRNIQLDLSAAPANVDGIVGWSQVDGVIIEDVGIYKPTGHGIHCVFDGVSGLPDGWRVRGVLVNQGLARGFSFQAADMELEDCHAVQCTDGFFWTNLTNSALIGCRSANNSISGYHWQGGAASGYLNMVGCSSDSNSQYGLFVDSVTSTGTPILNLTGFSSKNDNVAASTYTAVQVSSSSIPIVASGFASWATTPGTTGTKYGFGFSGVTNPPVVISGAYIQAVTDWISPAPPANVTWRNVMKDIGSGPTAVADSDPQVGSVTAGDTSIVIGGTSTAPTIATGTLDVIAADHPAAANWSNNSHKITSLANGSGAQDAAAFGQIPVVEGTIGNIKPTGTAASLGSSGKWPDSDHVHVQTYGGVFGDGSDGPQTFDGSTTILGLVPSGSAYTLTRDIFCGAVTINNGVTIKTAGYRIFCQGALVNNGTISNNGNNATGTGANGGSATNSGSTRAGTAGASGGTGVSGSGGSATGLTSPGAGQGGNGGAGTSGGAGSGGAVSAAAATWIYRSNPTVTVGQINASQFNYAGGTGGGGGGSDASSNPGGAAGGGAGMIIIAAWSVNNGSGTISATGGNGFAAAAGNAGGGAGGGGGNIIVYTLSAWTAGTTAVTGGSLGAGHGTGSNGNNGGAGTVLNVVIS